ncbi:hypothetical protein LRH25_14405 [Ideonella azotifigens]|nr:hypothetical protein [Ideonella azotifigens]MCD2341532.1 hypothetical protein [Ideonella azotifigens]
MRLRSLAQGLAQGLQLPGQRDAGGVVAGGFCRLRPEAADQHALAGAQRAIGVGAQFQPGAAEAAAVVVGLVDQVTQRELAGVLGAGQLHAQLLVVVIEHQLVEALAAELLALVA